MNQTDLPAETVRQNVLHSGTDPRLPRQWMILARVAWFVLVLVALGLFVATLPIYFTLLQTPCLTTSCSSGQPAPGTAQVLASVGLSLSAYALFILTITVIANLVSLVIGALLLWKKPDHWMALLVATYLVLNVSSTGGGLEALSHLLGPMLAIVLSGFFNLLSSVCSILIFCLFPNGRFVPRWTRWLVVFTIVVSVLLTILRPSPSTVLETLSGVLWFSLLISVVIAQLYRYRRVSTPVERQQTKWVVFTFALGGIVYFVLFLPELIFPSLRYGSLYDIVGNVIPSFCLTLLTALSFGIAILRYRLYDIDILIRRTLIYGTLTVLLALVYIGSIILLQFLLRGLIGQTNDVAIVVSTLTIAALFQPLRRRIQTIIDRRFYRRKYDAAKILEAFSATLRTEVDLNQLREQLGAVVEETMQPTFVSLWLRPPEHDEKRKPWRANPPVPLEGR